MGPRQTAMLLQLPIAHREAAILEGLRLLAENVSILAADAQTLHDAGRYRGATILDTMAAEEAAKAFLLLDVVRAGWADQKLTAQVLGRWFRSRLGVWTVRLPPRQARPRPGRADRRRLTARAGRWVPGHAARSEQVVVDVRAGPLLARRWQAPASARPIPSG